MTTDQSTTLSLLFPPDAPAATTTRSGIPNEDDLGLHMIVTMIDPDGQHQRFIADTLSHLIYDPHTIRYRQAIFADLQRLPQLVEQLLALLPHLRDLTDSGGSLLWHSDTPLLQVASRLAELDNYVRCVEELSSALDDAGDALSAEGLLALRTSLNTLRAEPDYVQLAQELPELRSRMNEASSITIGVNLDPQLNPESATIVAINTTRFAGKGTLLDRLLGDHAAQETTRGVSSLYKANENQPHTPEHDLFRDMRRLLERIAAPVAKVLDRYRRIRLGPLVTIEPELAFYLGAVKLANELQAAGLPLCQPKIAPADERTCVIEDTYNIDLVLRMRHLHDTELTKTVVTNDVTFDQHATIALLTGPNSGGKTTYTRAVGQAHILFQAGLPIPGRQARISPVDGIYTHFATAERLDIGRGRLAEELERMATIFASASHNSLILINEPFTSTDYNAARVLGRDLVAGLQMLGARTLLVTHLHDLVHDALALNKGTTHAGITSLVAGATTTDDMDEGLQPTYHVTRGQPQNVNYATELAHRYGLSREQIARTLRERGLTD